MKIKALVRFAVLLLSIQTVFAEPCKKIAVVWRDWNDPGRMEWNYLTGRQREWWIDKGQKRYTNVCISQSPQEADWIISWSLNWSTEATAMTLPRDITAEQSGAIWSSAGNANYSSTTIVHETETKTGETDVMHVYMQAERVLRRDGSQSLYPFGDTYFALDPEQSNCIASSIASGLATGKAGRPMPNYRPPCGHADEKAFQDIVSHISDAADTPVLGFGFEPARTGLLVREIQPGLPAALAGLQNGDIVTGANGRRVKNLKDFDKIRKTFRYGQDIVLEVKRIEGLVKIAIRP